MRYLGMILCGVAIATPSVTAAAQAPQVSDWPIAAGSRVRILSPVLGSERRTGSVIAATSDTLVFRPPNASTSTAIGTPNIVKLEVAQGKHANKRKGALIGLGVGAIAGAIIGYTAYSRSRCDDPEFCFAVDFGRGGDTAFGAGLFGIVGLLVGTIAGTHQTDNWVPVPIPHH
jgi:hypothetical protein